MNQVALHSLPRLSSEALELARISGNVGRVVRRFFERYFPRDELVLEAEFPNSNPRSRALLLEHAQSLIDKVNQSVEEGLLGVSLDVSHLPETPTFADTYRLRVSIERGLPESLKERQNLLRKFDLLYRLYELVNCDFAVAA